MTFLSKFKIVALLTVGSFLVGCIDQKSLELTERSKQANQEAMKKCLDAGGLPGFYYDSGVPYILSCNFSVQTSIENHQKNLPAEAVSK